MRSTCYATPSLPRAIVDASRTGRRPRRGATAARRPARPAGRRRSPVANDGARIAPPSALLLLALEGRGLASPAGLLAVAPFLATAPRGVPQAVIVLPGLGATDRSTAALRLSRRPSRGDGDPGHAGRLEPRRPDCAPWLGPPRSSASASTPRSSPTLLRPAFPWAPSRPPPHALSASSRTRVHSLETQFQI